MKTSNRLNVVIDTNVLIASFPRKSKYHWLYRKLLDTAFNISISNDILTEYEEKFSEIYDEIVASDLIESLLTAENVIQIIPYYSWNLIGPDPDDNKFVDCAVASNADYIVTNDKHFNVLKKIEFPEINVITLDEFYKIIMDVK